MWRPADRSTCPRQRHTACTRSRARSKCAARMAMGSGCSSAESRRSCRSVSARIASSQPVTLPRSSKSICRLMQIDPSRHSVLRIDLDALARNYRMLRSHAAPKECAAVVKADAYGLGVAHVARRLLREGCRRFFVATLAEGRELRALAPNADIYIFEGAVEGGVASLVEVRLRPVLNTLEQMERWQGHGPAALHIDTG